MALTSTEIERVLDRSDPLLSNNVGKSPHKPSKIFFMILSDGILVILHYIGYHIKSSEIIDRTPKLMSV